MPAKNPKTAKPSDPNWKTGEQLEFLLENWPRFKHAQDAKKLDQFWERIFAEWHTRWPTTVAPGSSHANEPLENVRLMLQKERKGQIKSWFNNRCRGTDSVKSGRSKMKLDATEKRKLAPVQAYCTYAWELTLRSITVTRWEQQKASTMVPDDEDPNPEDDDGEAADGSSNAIPLAFKLKIAKEVYSELPDDEKKAINLRREEEQRKLYLPVYRLADAEDRIEKLNTHKRNQSILPETMNRILKNLEDQTGSLACLLVATVNPDTGAMGIQKFCQGRTAIGGLNFETMYGEDWEANVELKFGNWALRTFGDVDTDRRSLFTLSKTSTVSLQASIALLQAPAGVVRSESIPEATPPFQPVISPPLVTTSRKTQSAATKKGKSRSVAPLDSNPTLPPEESTPSLHVPASANTPVVQSKTTSAFGLLDTMSTSVPNPLTPSTACTANNDVTLLSQVETAAQVTQVSPILASQILEGIEPTQLVVAPAQLTANPPQDPIEPSQSRAVSESPPDMAIHSGPRITPALPRSTTDAPPIDATKPVQGYRARDSASVAPSRRGSIDGAPEIGLYLPAITGAPLHQDLVTDDTSETMIDLSDFISAFGNTDEESHVSSSQKTSDGCCDLSPPPSSQWRRSTSGREVSSDRSRSSSVAVEIPYFDPADLPSWMTKGRQWKHIATTHGGPDWERLLEVYMQQERRLAFRETGAKLTLEGRPSKIQEYFRYAHRPLRGNDLTVPGFGEEVVTWWKAIQPDWRRAGKKPPCGSTTWSYILSGGSKGTFLVVMCLAWWHRAHLRYLESARGPHRTHVKASYFDLPDHDTKWLELVKDLTLTMENAQSCEIPAKGKRKREQESASPQKRATTSRT